MDSDGKIKKSDYEDLAERYIALGKLEGVRAKQVKRKIVKIWEDYYAQSAINDELPEQEFLQCLRDHKDMLFDTCLQFFGLLFDVIDLNGDGVIQREEYALFLKVFRIEDKEDVKNAFNVVDTNGDGQLSSDEFIYAGCDYFMTNDETLPSRFIFGPIY